MEKEKEVEVKKEGVELEAEMVERENKNKENEKEDKKKKKVKGNIKRKEEEAKSKKNKRKKIKKRFPTQTIRWLSVIFGLVNNAFIYLLFLPCLIVWITVYACMCIPKALDDHFLLCFQ